MQKIKNKYLYPKHPKSNRGTVWFYPFKNHADVLVDPGDGKPPIEFKIYYKNKCKTCFKNQKSHNIEPYTLD